MWDWVLLVVDSWEVTPDWVLLVVGSHVGLVVVEETEGEEVDDPTQNGDSEAGDSAEESKVGCVNY